MTHFPPDLNRLIDSLGKDMLPWVNRRKAMTCTQAGNTGTGSPKTGAQAGYLWVITPENNMPVQALNAIAFDYAVGIWVEVGDNRKSGEAEIIRLLVSENAQKGGDNYVALAAQGPSSVNGFPHHKYDATTAPTVNDDETLFFHQLSLWVNVSTDIAYICTDPTAGAAVWQAVGSMTSFTLAGDSGTSAITDGNTLTVAGGASNGIDTSVSGDTVTIALDINELTTETTIDAGADFIPLYDTSAAENNKVAVNDIPAKAIIKVKNTSGATANAEEVGYISSAGEYKTTTTANDNVEWCVVHTGGANNADIYVQRRGRCFVEYVSTAPSAGDFLVTSTTAGSCATNGATMRPEVFAVCLAAGSGNRVEALLLTQRKTLYMTNANNVLQVLNHSTTNFVALINAGGSGGLTTTNVPYDTISAGAENVIVPSATTELGKMRLWNTTRNSYRLITAVDTANDKITTVASTDTWADNDAITIQSQTVTTGGTEKAIEVDMSQMSGYPPLATAIFLTAVIQDTGASQATLNLHPFETYATSKRSSMLTQVANFYMVLGDRSIPLMSGVFCYDATATGAGTLFHQFALRGFQVAAS